MNERNQNNRVANAVVGALLAVSVALIAFPMMGDEIKFKFKSPSFSGVGTSSHYLTIDSQEMTRKEAIEAEIKAMKEQLERDAENTTLARFIKNFESFETRGTWEVQGDFMGGPFINYLVKDSINNRTLYIEGIVFSPSQRKRDNIIELEAIIKTLKIFKN